MTRLDRAIAAYKRAAGALATADSRTRAARTIRDQRIADIYDACGTIRQTALLTGLSHTGVEKALARLTN